MDSKYSNGSKKHKDKRQQQQQQHQRHLSSSSHESTTNLIIDDELMQQQQQQHHHHRFSHANTNSTSCNSTNTKKKWKCMQCTYENWPSALKCTICLNSKISSSTNATSQNTSFHSVSSSPSLLSTMGGGGCADTLPFLVGGVESNAKTGRNLTRKQQNQQHQQQQQSTSSNLVKMHTLNNSFNERKLVKNSVKHETDEITAPQSAPLTETHNNNNIGKVP